MNTIKELEKEDEMLNINIELYAPSPHILTPEEYNKILEEKIEEK